MYEALILKLCKPWDSRPSKPWLALLVEAPDRPTLRWTGRSAKDADVQSSGEAVWSFFFFLFVFVCFCFDLPRDFEEYFFLFSGWWSWLIFFLSAFSLDESLFMGVVVLILTVFFRIGWGFVRFFCAFVAGSFWVFIWCLGSKEDDLDDEPLSK